jgi:hypothetical protein
MDTDVRTPIPSLPTPGSPSKPRRRGRWIALVTAGVLVAGSIGWIANVEPLDGGSFGFDPLVGLPAEMARSAKVQDVDAFGVDGRVLTVRVEPGSRFTLIVSIRNTGPVPITIQGVESDSRDLGRRLVGMTPDLYAAGTIEQPEPFRPFSLPPHGEAALEIEFSVGDQVCLDPSSTISGYEQRLTFTIFGVERTQPVDAGLQLNLRGTKSSVC